MKSKVLRIVLSVMLFGFVMATPGSSTYITSEAILSYGGFYVSSAAASANITQTVYLILGGTTTALALNHFTHASPNRLTYTGVSTKIFEIICSISFTSSQSNQIARFRVAKNGTSDANSEVARKLGTGTDIGALALIDEISLATNDYLEVYATLDVSSTDTITADKMVCLIVE